MILNVSLGLTFYEIEHYLLRQRGTLGLTF